MDFLDKLTWLMERDGLNKSSLSAKSGIPYTTLDSFYKKGYQNAKLPTLQKLADFFNTTLDYLVLDNITDPNYGKAEGFKVDYNEMTHIKKYRSLDPEGQGAVDNILNYEMSRSDRIKRLLDDYANTPDDKKQDLIKDWEARLGHDI